MKVKELIEEVRMSDLRVAVAFTFNKGFELTTIIEAPDVYKDILDSEIGWFTKSSRYDLIIHI